MYAGNVQMRSEVLQHPFSTPIASSDPTTDSHIHPDFAACATNRTFTASILCRVQRRAMNTCMIRFATQQEQDAARAEWFATRDDRKKEREEKEEKRKEQEKFHREWWGLDEQGRRILKKEGGEGAGG